MKVTITGDLGSGKSSVAKQLCKKLNYEYISTGQLQRRIAEEYKVNSLELNKIAKTNEAIDKKIDNYLISLNESDADIIIDSRLAWHFVKNTLKVYLEVHDEIGADRIFNDKNRLNEPDYTDKLSALRKIQERKTVENERFLKKYNIHCEDLSNYDVIINTSASSIEATSKLIARLIDMREKGIDLPQYWVSPKFLFPGEPVPPMASEEAKEIGEKVKKSGVNLDEPINCVKWSEFYFIWDGHKQYSGYLYSNISYMPIKIVEENDEELQKGHSIDSFVRSSFNLSRYHDWEDAHKFKYPLYPELKPALR